MLFVVCCFLFKINVFTKNSFRNIISLDLGQAPCFVRPDLGPNCLQTTLAGKRLNRYRSFSDASRILILQLFYISFNTN